MLFIISILIMLIFLLTIPLKIKIIYHNSNLNIYFLNFHWLKSNHKRKSKYNMKNINEKHKKYNIKLKIFKNTLDKIKFKPKAKIYIFLNYDLEDADNSAIIYGIIYSFLPYICNYLNHILKIRTFKCNIKPLFKNKNFIDFKVTGIFYVNLVKIIYIFISFKINSKDFK